MEQNERTEKIQRLKMMRDEFNAVAAKYDVVTAFILCDGNNPQNLFLSHFFAEASYSMAKMRNFPGMEGDTEMLGSAVDITEAALQDFEARKLLIATIDIMKQMGEQASILGKQLTGGASTLQLIINQIDLKILQEKVINN